MIAWCPTFVLFEATFQTAVNLAFNDHKYFIIAALAKKAKTQNRYMH